ncbi:MAG TPA: energy transducer TonB [Magnetospirillaceae bacterium]|nr:energy transducer TonB [Magnetospirillaceae bacterium]
MIRFLAILALLISSTAYSADPEPINPVFRKPDAAPPPPAIRHIPMLVQPKLMPDTCQPPQYPVASHEAHEEGTVGFDLLIDVDGRPVIGRVVQSSGHPRLDEAAKEAFGKCSFKPGTVDGKPEKVWFHLQYVWTVQ